jgi:hypothetical protein
MQAIFPRSVSGLPPAGTGLVQQPEDFWDVVLGSGYRATADALSPAHRAQVRDRAVAELRSRGTTAITTNVVYGTATKPA